MLTELRVRDLGVIRDLALELGPGMTVLTGETGAGKTLLVEALQLVTGWRGSAQLVRAGAAETLVEARFELDAPGDDGEAERLLVRSVPASGRSRAWVDGRMAPVSALAEAGAALVDIHGQHEHQALAATAAQRRALDRFAGTELDRLVAARRAVVDLERRLAEVGGDERQRAREADVLHHQVIEIERAGLSDLDEDAALAAEESRLADATACRESAARGLAVLEGDGGGDLQPSVVGLLGEAVSALSGREAFAPWEPRLRAAAAELADVASDLRRAVDGWEDDPARLAEVQSRRRLLADLCRKYGQTLADVVAFGEESRRSFVALERAAATAEELAGMLDDARREVAAAEDAVRRVRLRTAPRLADAVTGRLGRLAMGDARLEVTVGDEGPGDAVQFLLAANPGEPPLPLSRVASGGELARTMLALRLVVGGGAPTALFDEVDAGVGGAAALALADALREVADRRQVLVVTHLAQVAAAAHRHVAVRKVLAEDGRTETTVEVLDPDARVVELSRMLSGHPQSRTARAHAEELLAARSDGAVPAERGDRRERSTTAARPSG